MDLADFVILCMFSIITFEYVVILLKNDEIEKLKRKLSGLKGAEEKVKKIQEIVMPPKRKK